MSIYKHKLLGVLYLMNYLFVFIERKMHKHYNKIKIKIFILKKIFFFCT